MEQPEKKKRLRLLFVDDEPELLKFFTRVFDSEYEVTLAENGEEAVELIETRGPFAAIVADLNMPGMNGIEFLDHARKLAPDTVRLMLTGYASEETTIEAVNRGDVFKFLTKPVRVRDLADAVESAARRYQVALAERELLEKTLRGSIEMLIQALSLASPGIFGRASRLRDDMLLFCKALGISDSWELETGAMLSQIGLLTASDSLIDKVMQDIELDDTERDSFHRQAEIGAELVNKVPRLEPVAQIIRLQYKNIDGSGFPNDVEMIGDAIPKGARMLRILQDMQSALNQGQDRRSVMRHMAKQTSWYDPGLLKALETSEAGRYETEIKEVSVLALQAGSVLVDDLYNNEGMLILRSGQEISEYVAEKLRGFAVDDVIDPMIKVTRGFSADSET